MGTQLTGGVLRTKHCLARSQSPSAAGHQPWWPWNLGAFWGQGHHLPTGWTPSTQPQGAFPNRQPDRQGGGSHRGASLLLASEFPGPASWLQTEQQAQPLPQHHTRPVGVSGLGVLEPRQVLLRPVETEAERPEVGGDLWGRWGKAGGQP